MRGEPISGKLLMTDPCPPKEPKTVDYAAARIAVRDAAWYQRAFIICFLCDVVGMVMLFNARPVLLNVIATASFVLAASVAGAICVFMLSVRVFGPRIGGILGVLAIVPVFGVVPLLFLNWKATTMISQQGRHVGLMGARDRRSYDG